METQREGTGRRALELRCVWSHEVRIAHLDLADDGEGE